MTPSTLYPTPICVLLTAFFFLPQCPGPWPRALPVDMCPIAQAVQQSKGNGPGLSPETPAVLNRGGALQGIAEVTVIKPCSPLVPARQQQPGGRKGVPKLGGLERLREAKTRVQTLPPSAQADGVT